MDLQTFVDEDGMNENGEEIAEKDYYISKVYDIREDGMVEILMPMEKAKMILLSVDEEYQVYFYANKGIFTGTARVAERYRDENVTVAVLEMISTLKKQQRREYYRYCCMIGMTSRKLGLEEATDYEENHRLLSGEEPDGKCVIVDISGGGMRFVSPEKYERGNLIHCRFMIKVKDENRIYNVVMRILDCRDMGNGTKNVEYRGQFIAMGNYERESIIKFIFEEERKLRQRK